MGNGTVAKLQKKAARMILSCAGKLSKKIVEM
jgi:hypothetical protein